MGRLFLNGDFWELPIVKELMGENDYRIPLTEERWLRVADSLPDAVATLGKKIEMDCTKKIKHAARQAFRTDGLRLYFNRHEPDTEEGHDRIPACLLSATAFFKHDICGCPAFDGYVQILGKRAIIY